jgi:hypothetical protein
MSHFTGVLGVDELTGAPEIHWIAGQSSWYMYVINDTSHRIRRLVDFVLLYSYYSAGTSANFDGQRLHVLKGSSTDIWASTWSYAGTDYNSK